MKTLKMKNCVLIVEKQDCGGRGRRQNKGTVEVNIGRGRRLKGGRGLTGQKKSTE